nr:hypothetical protein [Tanacetum cinerariifolium]
MDLKQAEETKAKSSIKEPPELELKELPSHIEYDFLEDTDKLPVIIAKDLKDVEIEALIKVLKSYKRAITWKISDIKGIDPRFCTHKILMEEDYKPAVQSQRRVSPIHCVPKKGGMTVVANENNELILTRLVTGWRVCIDYKKLNDATRKDHFPLPFMDQMLERLAENEFYCFLLVLSREWIVLGHKISKFGIEVDRAKVDVITKLPHPTTVKGVRSFLGHVGFYRRFIQDFSKIARPMNHLLEKETPFVFSKECVDAFNTLKKKLTEASILVVPDWNLPFELMCDASDFAIGEVLGQRKTKHFQPIHYASKTMTETQIHYTTTEKQMLAVVYAFEKFWPYLVLSKRYDNLADDHLSRLENPHKDVLVNKDINENFPLETLGAYLVIVPHEHKAYWALKHVNFDLKTAGDHRKLQLNELNELRDQAYENSVIYKESTKKLHDSKIKNRIFNVGDQVLLFNYCLKNFSGKLKTRWSGPFTITQVFPYGTVELSQPNGPNFKVNGHRVKHYFRGDIPSNVVPDLHTFPMDKYMRGSSQAM